MKAPRHSAAIRTVTAFFGAPEPVSELVPESVPELVPEPGAPNVNRYS